MKALCFHFPFLHLARYPRLLQGSFTPREKIDLMVLMHSGFILLRVAVARSRKLKKNFDHAFLLFSAEEADGSLPSLGERLILRAHCFRRQRLFKDLLLHYCYVRHSPITRACRTLFRYVPHPHLWGVLGIITDLLLQGSTRRQFGDISVLPGSILQGTLPGYPAVPFSIWFPVSVFANLLSFIIKIHSREASGLPVLT